MISALPSFISTKPNFFIAKNSIDCFLGTFKEVIGLGDKFAGAKTGLCFKKDNKVVTLKSK
jgi:hypothetical protein